MGYIYCITNLINNKQYVGKTTYSVKRGWKQHCSDYKKLKCANRPLYKAMNKYGLEHFHIEEIENVENNMLDEREKYWIKYYNSYNNGYNSTIGGREIALYDFDEEQIISDYI